MPFLKLAPERVNIDVAKAMAFVEQNHGVSRFAQVREIATAALGKAKLTPTEYFQYGVFDPRLSRSQKARFFSERSNAEFNRILSPPELGAMPGLLRDKVLLGQVLNGFGLPVPEILALYSPDGRYGRLNTLMTADDIGHHFRTTEVWPQFGKPTVAGQGIGAASFIGYAEDTGMLILGSGEEVPLDTFATLIVRNFPQGYVLQPFLRQDPRAEALTGPAVGVLRVVTVATSDGPELLYAVWKFPGADAMSDGVQDGAGPPGMAYVDPDTACVTEAFFGDRITGQDGAISPVTGAKLAGAEVPFFEQCVQLAGDAHKVIPTHGIIGWDMILGTDGPVIGEANPNPFHMMVQRALGRPLDDERYFAVLERANAHRDSRRALAKQMGRLAPWRA